MEYRYMIYNSMRKSFQFPRICETTEKEANTLLFRTIGNDARKWRFEIRKVEKEKAYKIRQELKDVNKANRIHSELENISFEEILALVIKNREIKENTNE